MTFDASRLSEYPLFDRFWRTEDPTDGLAHRGLDEATPAGAQKLIDFALSHELDGRPSRADSMKIDPSERALVKHLLEDPHYSAFFELDAKPILRSAFGIANDADGTSRLPRPSGGRIPIIEAVESCFELRHQQISNLPELFTAELGRRRSELLASNKSPYERSVFLTGLFKSYTAALLSGGERPNTEAVGKALLNTLTAQPHAAPVALTRVDGLGLSFAQALMLGLDADRFSGSYPGAFPDAPYTYLSMNPSVVAETAKAMAFVDKWRSAVGLEPGAAAYEKKPVLGWMLGETSGHNKPGNLTESRPFSTSGLSWGTLLFPADDEIAALPVKDGFEIPIDCIDGLGNPIRAFTGDSIRVVDEDGNPVTATKVVADGRWSAVFGAESGNPIDPSKVKGLICDPFGNVRGDGSTEGSMNMYWWGYCDRNTAQRLYKSRFEIPELDADVVRIQVDGDVIEIPREAAQTILDADVPDLVSNQTFAGFRFDDEPASIELESGETIVGRVDGLELVPGPSTTRRDGDRIVLDASDDHPIGAFTAKLNDGTTRKIAAGEAKRLIGENKKDFRPSQYLAWIEKHGGLYASDASLGPVVSNGVRWVNEISIEKGSKDDRPDWASSGEMMGVDGPPNLGPGDEILFVRGLYGSTRGADPSSSAFSGWMQVDKKGSVVNEGFFDGAPDFVWGAQGPLDWTKPSSFNPYVDPKLRLAIFVNGIRDESRLEAMADRLGLPDDWRSLRCA